VENAVDFLTGLDRKQFRNLCNAVWSSSHGKVSLTTLPALMEKWIKDNA